MKLSIITINYNNALGLKKTLDSVVSQICTDFEHIIVDGASTDESVEIIRTYSQLPIANRYKITWLSEPDTGIYNAMNKGVRLANGEYTLMLNSGDYLVDEYVIENILPLLDCTDIIQGNTIEEHSNYKMRNRGYGKSDVDFFDVMKGYFLHQAAFCRRDLFYKYGLFDESYRIIGDTKFFMTCLGLNNASFKYIDVDIANYDLNGVSADTNEKWLQLRLHETQRLRNELYSSRLNRFFEENDKKVRLYNLLRQHQWIWNIVMLLVRVHNIIYQKDLILPRRSLLKK